MSTTMAKPGMERKWYIIDAAGKPLGRTAVIAANLLDSGVDLVASMDVGLA